MQRIEASEARNVFAGKCQATHMLSQRPTAHHLQDLEIRGTDDFSAIARPGDGRRVVAGKFKNMGGN